ncbi:toll-like receptor 5 [Cheilinus undulatus]|uniref:toll-like receptor 5 n=1 Tax=Cheilinus undulatus TaxID=241271 RepID=UPI001BD3498F|nr:toll-like receptor 5 [Cheilinus undulatus]
MWTLPLLFLFIGLHLQVSTCYQSCTLYGLIAACASQQHHWVPVLPPSITHLYLEMNFISEINSTSLRAYNQLQELDLGRQYVPLIIRNNSFLSQGKLKRLVLGFNHYLRLEPRAFAGLYRLEHLFLDYCDLSDSILEQRYLEPLRSLETLDLFGNLIEKLKPGLFFQNLPNFQQLNLTLNRIDRLCDDDLAGFQGKHFAFLNLGSNKLFQNNTGKFDWERCGNPFKGISFDKLDISLNGFNLNTLRQFFKAIAGTQIAHLISYGMIGKGFSHNNVPDPDKDTFKGLINSTVGTLDLSGNYIFALQKAVFSPLKDAKIIDISRNKINRINQNAFDGLRDNLQLLNLSYNLLGEVYSDTFANLASLRVLDLSYNHIGALGYKAFRGLHDLRALYLTGNSLRNLGFPSSLPNLIWLLLKDNKLNLIYGITEFVPHSTFVDISDNRLTNMEDLYVILAHLNQLDSFFFAGNFIKMCKPSQNVKVPHNITLRVLDLHDSSLQVLWSQGECLDLFHPLENLLGLNISYNLLVTLPHGIFSGLRSVVEMDLSFNALTYLQSDIFPASLKALHLSNNFLATPDPLAFHSISLLDLAENRFHCDCNLESFLKWLNVTDVIFLSPVFEFKCEFPADLRNLPLLSYSTTIEPCEGDDEKQMQDVKFALFIFSASLVFTVTLSGIIYARLRGKIFIIYKRIVGRILQGPKPILPVDEVKFDAFLCFSDNDYGWVEGALLKKLDNQFSEENILHCCFEARDFLPGEDHLSNIRDAIWESRKTVCIVSKEFLKDGWCLEAFSLAQGRMLEELSNILIMLVVGKVAHYQLMKYNAVRAFVQKRQYLTWPEDPQDLDWFYGHLISQILKDTKLKKTVEENPEPAQPDVQKEEDDGGQVENIKETAM